MPSARSTVGRVIVHVGLLCLTATAAQSQVELGHKILGALGIDAGGQAPPGVYVSARGVRFAASQVRDRNGNVVPLPGLELEALGGGLGAAWVLKPEKAPYFMFALAAPIARISLSIDDPRVSIDRSGFSDMYLLPLHVGWRWERFDAVGSYGVYAPTGQFAPRSGSVGSGHWTHQLSLGGAAYFDEDKTRRMSALVSYDINTRKRGIDVTRGSTLQVQGGAGIGVGKVATIGVAAYALRQVTKDRGADIPPVLRGVWDRDYGLGPEAQLKLPIGLRLETRAMWDFGARSRADGGVVVASLTYRL